MAGILIITRFNQAQEAAAVTDTPTVALPTPTTTSTATATPTDTPFPTPTGTRVVGSGVATGEPIVDAGTVDPNATPTGTRVVPLGTPTGVPDTLTTPTPPPTIPDSGGVLLPVANTYLLWLGGGLLFVLLIYGVHSRHKSPTEKPDE